MKYILVVLILVFILIALYLITTKTESHQQSQQQKSNSELTDHRAGQVDPYSGTLLKIDKQQYDRYILAYKTTSHYLLSMITEFGDLSGNEEYKIHKFLLSEIGDWYVIKVSKEINFFTYHNLVGWFKGYDENPDIPAYSFGYSINKIDSKQDYIFYLDPNIATGDTEIGGFNNGKSFFINLPSAYEPGGNLTITSDFKISMNETIEFLATNGFDIKVLDSLEFAEHQIKMNE